MDNADGDSGAGLVTVARHVAGAVGGVLDRRAEVELMLDEELPDRPARRTPLVLAIDGRSGAGKTLLAHAAAVELRAGAAPDIAVLALEDLYLGWDGLQAGLDAAAGLLADLAAGRAGSAPRWDWNDSRVDGLVTVGHPLPSVLVVEGCGAGSDTLAPYVDLLVWIEVPEERRRRRAQARDGEWGVPWERWAAAEAELLARRDAPALADLVVGTTDA